MRHMYLTTAALTQMAPFLSTATLNVPAQARCQELTFLQLYTRRDSEGSLLQRGHGVCI